MNEGKMKYCPICGLKQPISNRFCAKCGYAFGGNEVPQHKHKKVSRQVTESVQQAPKPQQQASRKISVPTTQNTKLKKSHKGLAKWWALLIAVLIVMVGANIFYYENSQKQIAQAQQNYENNPLAGQKVTFQYFLGHHLDVSNATYLGIEYKTYYLIAKHKNIDSSSMTLLKHYLKTGLKSDYDAYLDSLNDKESDIDVDITDLLNKQDLIKMDPSEDLGRGSKVRLYLNLPKKIEQKYHIVSKPRTVIVKKITK